MRLVLAFLLRWIVTSFGLWLAIRLFGNGESAPDVVAESSVFLVAGLILSIFNSFVKPINIQPASIHNNNRNTHNVKPPIFGPKLKLVFDDFLAA